MSSSANPIVQKYRLECRRQVYFVPTVYRAGRMLAAERNVSFSTFLRQLIEAELARLGRPALALETAEAPIDL